MSFISSDVRVLREIFPQGVKNGPIKAAPYAELFHKAPPANDWQKELLFNGMRDLSTGKYLPAAFVQVERQKERISSTFEPGLTFSFGSGPFLDNF